MNKQFSFSSIGVQEWLDYIYAGGQVRIDEECTAIANNFVEWLTTRFGLVASQVDYLVRLGTLVHEGCSADIQNTLQLQGHIGLEKAEATTQTRDVLHPKILWKEKQNAQQEAEEPQPDQKAKTIVQKAKLLFRISYEEISTN